MAAPTADFTGSENEVGAALQPRPMAGAISAWVSQPENRSALIQAGLQLLQPIAPGQSFGGHVGQAIGAGAEARDSMLTSQQAQRNAEIEQANESARTKAYAEASRAQTIAATAGGKPMTAYQLNQLSLAQQRIVLQRANAKFKAQESAFYTTGLPPESMKTMDQFIEEEMAAAGLGGAPAAAGGVVPPTSPGAGAPTLATALPAPPGRETATGKNGAKIYSDDGGVTWNPM